MSRPSLWSTEQSLYCCHCPRSVHLSPGESLSMQPHIIWETYVHMHYCECMILTHAAAGRELSVHTYIHCILVCMASDLYNEVQSIHILCMYVHIQYKHLGSTTPCLQPCACAALTVVCTCFKCMPDQGEDSGQLLACASTT